MQDLHWCIVRLTPLIFTGAQYQTTHSRHCNCRSRFGPTSRSVLGVEFFWFEKCLRDTRNVGFSKCSAANFQPTCQRNILFNEIELVDWRHPALIMRAGANVIERKKPAGQFRLRLMRFGG